ncbi:MULTISPECIES: SDR family NAD(P)-dependent oxidoreductase [Streptomyces]|uniref:SDR family NAD(P)-dependent oxidoreductase n=1 Tax=Streptomyces TaxID=1883 RepID=UPI001E33017C|nr:MULTISPECIES: SDR family NAD(P)-dependent oxidoreductase [Streptomyces]UFQ18437.1 SDR family oxidoreductase [Streptomyces huasconensis]WCL88049.1 SDR family NAD(P)-dependent oxidoreductase [Streptomyces sp. JCM 35825]
MAVTAYDLTGRTAFVTGAASGIGRASALLLAEAGATVHCADRDAQKLHETATLIKAVGGEAHTHVLDVADKEQIERAVTQAAGKTAITPGRLDIMAAIAGVMHSSPVLETRAEDLDRVLDINFKGVLYACQAAARAMIEAGTGGSIVTMASGAVDTGGPGLLCYGASKAAVVQLTKTLATEVGPHGIRVNAVAPGWVRTPMTERHDTRAQAHTEGIMVRMSPLGRVGEPDDVAHAVLHLASDASSFTTGQILRPNGGVAMPW